VHTQAPPIWRRRLGRRLHGGEDKESGREERPGVWQKGGWAEEIRRLLGSPTRLAAATWRGLPPHWSGAGDEERRGSSQPQKQAGRQATMY